MKKLLIGIMLVLSTFTAYAGIHESQLGRPVWKCVEGDVTWITINNENKSGLACGIVKHEYLIDFNYDNACWEIENNPCGEQKPDWVE